MRRKIVNEWRSEFLLPPKTFQSLKTAIDSTTNALRKEIFGKHPFADQIPKWNRIRIKIQEIKGG
jgi:hypothetical protein